MPVLGRAQTMLGAALHSPLLPRHQRTHAMEAVPSPWVLEWVSAESASPLWKLIPFQRPWTPKPTPPASSSPCLS